MFDAIKHALRQASHSSNILRQKSMGNLPQNEKKTVRSDFPPLSVPALCDAPCCCL